MTTSYNNLKCKQAEIYYYDYLCNENVEQIPGNIIEHIEKCHNCREKINRLNIGLSKYQSAESGNSKVAVAVTDLLNLHLAFIGDKVVCSKVRPFLPVILDPNLSIKVPTPITVHLDHCQQCAQDLKAIKSMNLTSTQSCRFSQLLADKTTGDSVICRKAQTVIPAVSLMDYENTNEQVLKHLCTCEHCRQDLYQHRETIRTECRSKDKKEAQTCSISDQLKMSDIFNYVVPYGLDPACEDAIFQNSIAPHLRDCAVCLAKIQTLHNIIYSIVERNESNVATIYRFSEFTETQEPGEFDDLYSGYPINVEITNRDEIDNERPASPISSVAVVRQKASLYHTSRFLSSGFIAVASVLLVVALFFRGSVAGALTLGQVFTAIQNTKNIHVSTIVPEYVNPVQESWFSRTRNIKITKKGDELTLLDFQNKQRKTKNLSNNSIDITELPDEYVTDIKPMLSKSLGLIPFYKLSDLPDGAKWNRVPDNELETALNNIEVYDLTWIDKRNTNLPVFSKIRFTVDSQTYLPLNTRYYSKFNINDEYTPSSTKIVEYLDDSAMQAVIDSF